MEQPTAWKWDAEMPKKPIKWTHVNSWSMGTIGFSLDNSFIRLGIDYAIRLFVYEYTYIGNKLIILFLIEYLIKNI